MPEKFKMELLVPSRLIGPIVELMADEGILVSISSFEEAPPPPKPKKTYHFRNGRRLKDISGHDLVMKSLQEKGTIPAQEFENIFVDHGFARNSASAALSKCITQGLIQRGARGYFIP